MKRLLLLSIGFVFLINNFIYSQFIIWEKLYPQTTDYLNGVYAFDTDTVITCGSYGEIFRTTDGGAHWTKITPISSKTLRNIAFVGAKGWITGNEGIFHSTDYGRTWNAQLITSSAVDGIYCISATEVWACGQNGLLYHTTDGGNTWITSPSGTSNWLTGITFTSSSKGFIVGFNRTSGYTTDGGATWTVTEGTNEPGELAWFDIAFFNANDGLRVGDFTPVVYRTDDGGYNWDATVMLPNNTTMNDNVGQAISITGTSRAYLALDKGRVARTDNYGFVWDEFVVGTDDDNFYSISSPATSSNTAWVVGYGGVIFKTTDSGSSWNSQIKTVPRKNLNDVFFIDDVKGWAVGDDGTLIVSQDSGKTWYQDYLPTKYPLYSVTFVNDEVGYISSDSGQVFYTGDNGVTWHKRSVGTIDRLRDIVFINENIGFACSDGGYGRIFQTTNRGRTWKYIHFAQPLYAITAADANTIIAVGFHTSVKRTTNRGRTWQNVSINLNTDARLFDVNFPTSKIGYACGESGILVKTMDGGLNWSQITVTGTDSSDVFNKVYFISADYGWVLGHNNMGEGIIFRTEDGGASWVPEQLGGTSQLNGINFTKNGRGFVVGNVGTILKTVMEVSSEPPFPAKYVFPLDWDYDITPLKLTLKWRRGTGAKPTSYKLYVGTDYPPSNLIAGINVGNVTEYTINDTLLFDTTYYWQVIPSNLNGDANNCPIWTFKTKESLYFGGGGTNCPGYFYANSLPGANGRPNQPSYDWIDPLIYGHTQITSWTATQGDNHYKGPVSLGFTFPFFGNQYTEIYISSNGAISFGGGIFDDGSNVTIPSTNAPNNFIAALMLPLWDNNGTGGVYYGTHNGKFVVTWYKNYVNKPGVSEYITFQTILQSNGTITFQYNSNLSTYPVQNFIANNALIGIEDDTGTQGEAYRSNGFGGPIFGSPNAVAFTVQDDTPTPVELTAFSATGEDGKIVLKWKTATEINNYGFEIQRQSENPEKDSWIAIGFVTGAGNSNSPQNYSFVDENAPGGLVRYRLKQIDIDGKFKFSEIVEVENSLPKIFELMQNYPNPFNPSTTISFNVPYKSRVKIDVYNILGRHIKTLIDKELTAGRHKVMWHGENSHGAKVGSGIYFVVLRANNIRLTKKMLLLK